MVDTSNIQLYMVKNTSKRLNISDEEYFSSKYGKYVSNSRLKYINGDQKGSPDQFFSELKSEFSPSLVLGSAVHELTLQKGEFTMGPKSGLPNGKLGAAALFAVEKYVKGNIGILDALRHGCKKACYYLNSIESHLNDVFNVAKSFYFIYKANNKPGMIWLSDDQRETCLKCVESIENNKSIQHTFNPSDVFDFVKSYNEDALFVDFIVVYDGQSVIIPVKLKVDNWTINIDKKKVSVNDLKTTSGMVSTFMNDGDHFDSFHYARQMALYTDVVKFYLQDSKDINIKDWTFDCKMCVVNTSKSNALKQYSACFNVSEERLKQGREEYERLIKTVGYYMITENRKL